VASWKLKTTENVLKALLKNGMDKIACEFASFYVENANEELLLFALHNYNEIFIKYSFRNSIFGGNLLLHDKVLDTLMNIFENGSKTELVLNTLIFSDLTRWDISRLKRFIEIYC
jgi:hypothetical protein